MPQQERVERFEDVVGSHLGPDGHRQGLPLELVQHRQHLVAAAIAELVVDEVNGPDMVRMRGPHSDDRAVLVIEPFALLVPLWKLQSFLAPQPLDLLVVNPPALNVKQLSDIAIAIPTVLLRQPCDCQPQCIVISRCRPILQGAPRDANHPTRPARRSDVASFWRV